MPSFVSHVVYAQKFIKQNLIDDPKNIFIFGSLIPDIRYLGVIDRASTHIPLEDPSKAWDLVNNLVTTKPEFSENDLNLFKMGFLFHNFLDFWWSDKFPISKTDRFKGAALKSYEDQLFYTKIENLNRLLDSIKEQTNFFGLKGVEQVDFKRWANINITYFSQQPTIEIQIKNFEKWKFFSEEQAKELLNALEKIPENINQQMENTYKSFQEDLNFLTI